jgi:hypothetical protein
MLTGEIKNQIDRIWDAIIASKKECAGAARLCRWSRNFGSSTSSANGVW